SSQGMFEPALKVLDILQSLDADPGRIAEAKRKIKQVQGEPIAEPVEPVAEAETSPDPAPEPPIPLEPEELPVEPDLIAADITDEVKPPTPITDSSENDEYEKQRIAALQQRVDQEPTSAATPESAAEIDKDDSFNDLAEQKRIAALMKRSGASDSELEQFSEETAEEATIPEVEDEAELQHIRALEKHAGITEDSTEEPESVAKEESPDTIEPQPESEPEIENDEELARIARLKERQESLPSDPIPEEKPIAKEPVENKWLKWVYVAGAVAVALLAIWLFWPVADKSPQQKLPPQAETPIVEQADVISEEVAEVVPIVIDTVEAEEKIVEEPEIVEVEVKQDIPKVEPPPVKSPPIVKSLPARNLQVNARARAAFLNGDYWLASTDWGREKKRVSSHYTIILLFACQNKTIMNAYRQLDKPADFFLLPRYIGDQQCYTICWGDFKSRSDALAWYKEIPTWFRDNGASPMVRSFKQIKISSDPPPVVKKAAVIIPIQKPEPEPEPQKVELVKKPEAEPPVIISVIEEPEETPIDTIAVETESESDELPNQITTVEEAFIDAMISIPMKEPDPQPEISEPELEPDQSDNDLLDSVIVLMADDRPDDWIEMDESTQALEPETEIAGDQFVEIAELESEIEPISEPEPDYTPSELLKLGRFTEAAGIWEIQKREKPKNYTIKLLVACQTGSVNEAYRALNQAEDFFILPKSVKGDECFAICWGDFTSKRDAKKRLKEVPEWFSRSGGKPAMTTFAKIYK
ncbi:MAG: hypothetical protein HQ528_04765, partial [Candidatus Marinimicrobia bacterium]|nr:hypothetical protein [Candidatus Neomarinimicrobiota bacterium]